MFYQGERIQILAPIVRGMDDIERQARLLSHGYLSTKPPTLSSGLHCIPWLSPWFNPWICLQLIYNFSEIFCVLPIVSYSYSVTSCDTLVMLTKFLPPFYKLPDIQEETPSLWEFIRELNATKSIPCDNFLYIYISNNPCFFHLLYLVTSL